MKRTDSEGLSGTERQLGRVERIASSLRSRALAGVLFGGAAAAIVLFSAANLLPSGTLDRPGSPVPIVFLLLFLAVAALGGAVAGRVRRRLDDLRLTVEVERTAGLGDGELRGAVELGETDGGSGGTFEVTPGVSAALARLQIERVGTALSGHSDAQLVPVSSSSVRRIGRRAVYIFLVAIAAATVSGIRGSERLGRTAAALASPWSAAFPPPPPPLSLLPAASEVERGSLADVRVSAPERRSVTVVWRSEGELPRRVTVAVDPGEGIAEGEIGPISAPVIYWAEDDFGASRDTLHIVPVDPLAVTSLQAEIRYPPHLGRPDELLARPLPPMVVPLGTVIRLRGSANYPVARMALTDGQNELELDLDPGGRGFEGVLTPAADGAWAWSISAAVSVPAVRPPPPIEIRVQRDARPDVNIPFPGRDTVVQAVKDLPLVVDAADDNGVQRLELVSWRVSAAGVRSETAVDVVVDSRSLQVRLVARPQLRLEGRDLLPGDTVLYYARARDANPENGAGVSDTFRVRLPTLTELRDAAAAETGDLANNAESLGEAARELERSAREASRRTPAQSDGARSEGAEPEPNSTFESTREGRRILDEAKDLQSDMATMREQIAEMREQLENSALSDPDLQRQLAELEALYAEILESGLGERIEELQRAMESLDQAELQSALSRMSSEMRDLREQIEQGVALMERVAVEQGMKSAEEQAEDMARRQRAAENNPARDEDWADQERRLADEADELSRDLRDLRERLEDAGADAAAEPTEAAEQSVAQASDMMRDAAAREGGESSQSADSESKSAAGSMQDAADQLAEARETLAEDWRQEAMAAVERATSEALELAREQSSLAESASEGGPEEQAAARGRQAAVRQGLENLMESLSEAGKKSALLDRRVGPAAADAAQVMDSLLARMGGSGGDQDGGQTAAQLVESLNEIAGRLLASRRQMESASSATGMEEALEAMSRMGQAQGGLNEETSGLMSLQQSGQALGGRARELGRRQAEIAQQLRDLGEESGADALAARPEELAEEADEIAQDLTAGALDPETLARQERLFRRLLDAGRAMEKEEQDPERRESETAGDVARTPVIDLDSGDIGGIAYPHPDEEALRGVPPAYRPLIMDYFDRINRDLSAPASDGSRR